jgi:hypothetical protein
VNCRKHDITNSIEIYLNQLVNKPDTDSFENGRFEEGKEKNRKFSKRFFDASKRFFDKSKDYEHLMRSIQNKRYQNYAFSGLQGVWGVPGK